MGKVNRYKVLPGAIPVFVKDPDGAWVAYKDYEASHETKSKSRYFLFNIPMDVVMEYMNETAIDTGMWIEDLALTVNVEIDDDGITEFAIRVRVGDGDRGPMQEWLGIQSIAKIQEQ